MSFKDLKNIPVDQFIAGLSTIPEADFHVGIVHDYVQNHPVDEVSLLQVETGAEKLQERRKNDNESPKQVAMDRWPDRGGGCRLKTRCSAGNAIDRWRAVVVLCPH